MPRTMLAIGAAAVAAALATAAWALSRPSASQHGALVYAKAVAFPGHRAEIFVASADGSHPRKIANGTSPVLSPDGRWVAFVRQPELLLMTSWGGLERSIVRHGGDFVGDVSWAPDSSKLVVADWGSRTSAGGLYVVEIPSGDAKLVARSDRIRGGVSNAGFSPDGKELAYARSSSTRSDVYVYSLTTGRTRQITGSGRATAPLWGRPGIAFYDGHAGPHGDVWLTRPDGSGARRLTHTNENIFPAAWSADGTRLLAANPAMHNGRLWAVSVASGKARQLTGWVGDLFAQGLSRDGSTVLAAVGCGGTGSPYGVVETLPFAGGKPTVIARGPCRASWNR